jgi:N-acetylglucosamine kinase-like BadF-type ATPase
MLLSVDGGATKTVAIIFDSKENKIKGMGISGPSNFVSAGPEMAEKNIRSAISNALNESSLNMDSIQSGIFGISGIGDSAKDTNTGTEIINRITRRTDFIKVNDGEPAYKLANINEEGIVFAGGTGSVCFYLLNGKMNRIGGWGWFIGDDGSASWISKRALNIATMEYDNIIYDKEILHSSEKYFEKDFRNLIADIEQIHDKRLVAGFAPYISRLAIDGNPIAMGILKESADYVSLTVKAAKKNFRKASRISILGGTVLAGKIYTDLIRSNLNEDIFIYPGYQVAIGGILILKEKIGDVIDFNLRDNIILQMEKIIRGPEKKEYEKYLNTIL